MLKLAFLIITALSNVGSALLLPPPYPAYRNLTADPIAVGHAVRDLHTTMKFYHGLIGLVVIKQTGWVKDLAYGQLTATSGALYRQAVLAVPNQNWTLILTEYEDITRAEHKQREQDPANLGLTLTVKNATAMNDALRAANATTVNGQAIPEGGAPNTTSTVWVYDPDGYMVELVQRSGPSDYFTVPQPSVTDGPGMKHVIRGQIDLTMANYTQAITFYRDILDFDISPGFEPLIGPNEYEEVGFIGSVFNISSNVAWAAVTGNCDPTTRCEYYEYDDPNRADLIYPAQDIGIGLTYYAVNNLDKIVQKVNAANVTIVTEGSEPVVVDGTRSILIRDPAGYLVLFLEGHTNPC